MVNDIRLTNDVIRIKTEKAKTGFYATFLEKPVLLALGFIFTTMVGTYFSHTLTSKMDANKESQERRRNAQSDAVLVLEKVSSAINERAYWSYKYLFAIQHLDEKDRNQERYEVIKHRYLETLDAWNEKWNLNRVLLKRYFSEEREFEFYYAGLREEKYSENLSITEKMRIINRGIFELEKECQDSECRKKKSEEIEDLYYAVSKDIYEFFNNLILDIQNENLASLPPS